MLEKKEMIMITSNISDERRRRNLRNGTIEGESLARPQQNIEKALAKTAAR